MKGLPRSTQLLIAAVLGLWAIVIYQLGAQWSVYPQYNYGWGVPLLVLYLLRERSKDRPDQGPASAGGGWALVLASFLLLLPARFVHEANPTWRLTSLLLGLEAVGASFGLLLLLGGKAWLRHFWFSTAFFLIAIPWPSTIEGMVIQSFTRANAATVTEGLALLAVPAVRHGNIIQLSNGLVGLEDACSGINSFQTTVMLTLFFGELYLLAWRRRCALLAIGVALAFLLNIARTFLLVFISLRFGGAAMEQWHDRAGWMILAGVFAVVWRLAIKLGSARVETEAPAATWPATAGSLSLATLLLLLTAELSTKGWYRWKETKAGVSVDWSLQLPSSLQTRDAATMNRAREEFRCDLGQGYEWTDPGGAFWQVFYFRWLPSDSLWNRTRVQLSKSHRPEICLPAGGIKFQEKLAIREFQAGPVRLPVARYVFSSGKTPIYVFFMVWEEGTQRGVGANMREDSRRRLRAALDGIRNKGQRLLEVIISGPGTQEAAERAFAARLREMIVPGPGP